MNDEPKSEMPDPATTDAETHATDWAGDSARWEREHGFESAPPPATSAPPGQTSDDDPDAETGVSLDQGSDDYDPDTATGASPGMASACHDLGLFSLDAVTKKLNIKPPGQA